jgi:hypothetical protein
MKTTLLKIYSLCILLILGVGLLQCGIYGKGDPVREVTEAIDRGNFSEAVRKAEGYMSSGGMDSGVMAVLDSLIDLTGRLRLDFRLTETEVRDQLVHLLGSPFTDDAFREWERSGLLEWRNIDGEKRYFARAASNLKRLLDHRKRKVHQGETEPPDDFALFKMEYAAGVIARPQDFGHPVTPVPMKVSYTITVEADAVPSEKVVRCWMPWPRENHTRQQQVQWVSSFPAAGIIASDSAEQRSLYLEQTAEAGTPLHFTSVFTYCSMGQYFDPERLASAPMADRGEMKAYLGEQLPHILFTLLIRNAADSIVGEATTPLEIVRRIFYWIDENISWAGALEYSVMPNIPEYVLTHRHGDCGMKTLLFMTLARYKGVAVKWQSGWMMHPGEVNLHDWCEVWYPGTGWVPLDMSFGRLPSGDPRVRDFYMTGIDPWRLIINDALGTPFQPQKKYRRSEPNDFQRGEVEGPDGNLYFNHWKYRLQVEYL